MAQFVPRPDPVTATDVVENLGAEMAARYAEAEERMIERVARLAAAGIDADEFPDVADRLRILRELRAEGARIAEQLADPDEVRRIIGIAEAEGRQAALEQLAIGRQRPNLSGITGTSDRAVGALTLDLASGLDNMSARITRWMPDAYQQVVSLVAPQVLAGVVTITQAQRQAAQRFLARGVTGFTDRAGRNWRIGTYAEMATRTAVHRAWTDANVGAMRDQAGIALVQIVIGLDACSVCAAHAGRVWSTDGTPAGTYTRPHAATGEPVTVTVAGTLDQARASGWDHPNCRCTVVGYFPGLTVPSASTHDPQAEADRDRLRELERRVRDLKRREAAAFDDITRQQLRRRIRGAQADIREHVATTGQVRKPYREQLGFSDGTTGTPRRPGGTRPPAPPTGTEPGDGAPELEVDDTPAWIRRHREAAARLPEDRLSIGRTGGDVVPAAEVRARAIRPIADEVDRARDALARQPQRLADADDVLAWVKADPRRLQQESWGDVAEQARRLGFSSGGRNPRYFLLEDFQRIRDSIDATEPGLRAVLSNAETRLAAAKRATYADEFVRGRDLDIDAFGNLGQNTRETLDAVIEAGRIVDDEVARRLRVATGRPTAPNPVELRAAQERANDANRVFGQVLYSGRDDVAELAAARQARDEAAAAYRELWQAAVDAENWEAVNRARITREVLGELRDYGGGARSTYVTASGANPSRALREAMEYAHGNYPTAWNEFATARAPRVELRKVKRGYNRNGELITLSGDDATQLARVATHELGHSMELAVPGLTNLEWAFHYARSDRVVDSATGVARRAPSRRMGAGYGKDEVYVPDQWSTNYTGKVYATGRIAVVDQWEVFTTGVESVFDNSRYFDRPEPLGDDAEFRRFILGVLSAL